jgi:hypothetical protein
MTRKIQMRNRKKILALAAIASLFPGCATLYRPVVDYAMDQAIEKAEQGMKDIAGDFVHEVATKPPPQPPPPGAGSWEWVVYALSVALGSVAVLVDRRIYHKKKRSCN